MAPDETVYVHWRRPTSPAAVGDGDDDELTASPLRHHYVIAAAAAAAAQLSAVLPL